MRLTIPSINRVPPMLRVSNSALEKNAFSGRWNISSKNRLMHGFIYIVERSILSRI
jgi:hypothetical protein